MLLKVVTCSVESLFFIHLPSVIVCSSDGMNYEMDCSFMPLDINKGKLENLSCSVTTEVS